MLGLLATSKAGHDKNQVYVIMKETDDYIYLVDGINRKISNPKKKNKKHIQIIKTDRVDEIQSKIADDSITDEFVKNIMKQYCKSKNTIKAVDQEV